MTSVIPQVIVTLSPEGELQIEEPINGVRRLIPLTQDNAGLRLLRILNAQKKKIDGERAERVRRIAAQPDWRLIAKHPNAEIREVLRLPTKSPELLATKSEFNLEDMGL